MNLHRIHDYFFQLSENQIYNIIKNKRIVSFDIFDTLIKRNCSPCEMVFLNTAYHYNELKCNTKIDPSKFKNDRIIAAREALLKTKRKCKEEINLDDIYNELYYKYNDSNLLKEIEIKEEIDCAFPNMPLKRIYDRCIEDGKKVYLISDMYLPSEVIVKILDKCGYHNYSGLLVSSEIGVKKSSGRLFEFYLQKYSLNKTDCIHIGDSFKSDLIAPLKLHIKYVKIAKNPNRSQFCRSERIKKEYKADYENLKQIINNGIDPKWNPYQKFGFECLGPMLFYFSIWLNHESKKKKIEKLFFLSRDGYLIKKVYDEIFDDYRVNYLHVSRRSVHVPLLHKIKDVEEYLLLNGKTKRWSLTEICNRLAIDDEEGKKIWKELGFSDDFSFQISEIQKNKKLLNFFQRLDIEKSLSISKKEFDACKAYFNNMGFSGKVGIIDSGGNLTTQKCLNILKQYGVFQADITGYYLWARNHKSNEQDVHLYPCENESMLGGITIICELPMTPDEGSTIYYQYNDNEQLSVFPVFDLYEFQNNEKVKKVIHDIQFGTMAFARMMKSSRYIVPDSSVVFHNAKMAGAYPRLFDANLFGDLFFYGDKKETYLAKPNSLFYYMIHPGRLIRELKLIRWKIGFLKRLFKIPFPYYDIIYKIKKRHS